MKVASKENVERIQRLLRLRKRVEDERRAAAARAGMQAQAAEFARRQAESLETNMGKSLLSPQPLPAAELDFRASQVERARHGVALREQELDEARRYQREATQKLALAKRDVIALERVEARLQRALDDRRRQAEQTASDEAGARITRRAPK